MHGSCPRLRVRRHYRCGRTRATRATDGSRGGSDRNDESLQNCEESWKSESEIGTGGPGPAAYKTREREPHGTLRQAKMKNGCLQRPILNELVDRVLVAAIDAHLNSTKQSD